MRLHAAPAQTADTASRKHRPDKMSSLKIIWRSTKPPYTHPMASPEFEPRPLQRATAAQQIAEQIRAAIRAGRLAAGQRLPSEHDLAADYRVSRPTVREALRILAAGRLVEATRGAGGGTFVALPAPAAAAESL